MRREGILAAYRSRLGRGWARLARCERGVAATEFAIFAPMVILGILMMADVGGAIAERMDMDRDVRAGAQAAMSLNNDMSAIETIVLASTEDAAALDVAVSLQCLCAGASASCSTPCADTTAPAAFVEIEAERSYAGIILPARTLRSQTRVQIR
jgi:Flp pilus assembly protein TadG